MTTNFLSKEINKRKMLSVSALFLFGAVGLTANASSPSKKEELILRNITITAIDKNNRKHSVPLTTIVFQKDNHMSDYKEIPSLNLQVKTDNSAREKDAKLMGSIIKTSVNAHFMIRNNRAPSFSDIKEIRIAGTFDNKKIETSIPATEIFGGDLFGYDLGKFVQTLFNKAIDSVPPPPTPCLRNGKWTLDCN